MKSIEDINKMQTPRKAVWIGADDSGFRSVWDSIAALGSTQKNVNFMKGTSASDNANGGIYAYASGGISAYAEGGFSTGIYKGGAPIHKFAEPETVWEACISGKLDQRERNRQIWVETGERLGIGAGGQATVYVPTSVTVRDADHRLVGTMAVVADQLIDGYAEEQAQAGRRAGY